MTAPIESCKNDANMGKHIRYLWGVVECPWCWEASSASLKRNWLKCCKSPGAKVPDGNSQKRRSQQTTPLSSPQTLQETNFDRLPFYPRNRISRSAQQGGNMQCSRSTTKWIIKIYQGLIFQLEKKVWYVPKHHWTLGPRFGGNHDGNGKTPLKIPLRPTIWTASAGKNLCPTVAGTEWKSEFRPSDSIRTLKKLDWLTHDHLRNNWVATWNQHVRSTYVMSHLLHWLITIFMVDLKIHEWTLACTTTAGQCTFHCCSPPGLFHDYWAVLINHWTNIAPLSWTWKLNM